MSVAKPLMNEVFSARLPELVTASFAAKYVLVLAACNMGGRLGWAALSDKIGRRATFGLVTASSVPLWCSLPWVIEQVMVSGSSVPLYAFIGGTGLAITVMGAAFATLPAYEAELYGPKHVGAIHGKMLFWPAAAAFAGPSMIM